MVPTLICLALKRKKELNWMVHPRSLSVASASLVTGVVSRCVLMAS